MYLEIRRGSTGNKIYEDSSGQGTDWKYDLATGDYTYVFSGTNLEKKSFEAFKNVGNYKKALLTILDYLNKEIEKISTQVNAQAVVINHNFVETCKHILDPISEIMPKLKGKLSHSEKLREVAQFIEKSDSADIASALLDVDRAITNLRTQIFGMQVIAGEYKPDKSVAHSLIPLIDSLLVPFDRSFEEKSMRVINGNDGIYKQDPIYLDYNLINWAFYHLLNNAVKYCLEGSDLIIQSNSSKRTISIDMTSVRVASEEAESIFKPNVRGKYAEGLPGDGLGMHFARVGLENMGAEIKFIPDTVLITKDNTEREYCKNRIEIYLS